MRRFWIVVVLGSVLMAGLLAVNFSGVLPIPAGPLGEQVSPAPDPGGVSTLNYDPRQTPRYLTALVENTGPLGVTVIGVTPVGVSVPGSVEVVGSMPFDSGDPDQYGADGMDQVMLGIVEEPGPGWARPQPVTGVTVDPKGSAQYQGRAFLVRVTPDPARETSVLRFDVAYTIGPIHFVTTAWGPIGTTLVMCPSDRPLAGDPDCVAR